MWIIIGIIVILVVYNALSSSGSQAKSKPAHSPSRPTPQRNIQSSLPEKKAQAKTVYRSKNKLPENLVITEEFKSAFELMENTTKCAYITGKAGTGKSTLLTYFRQKTKKNVIVLAPTGIAAINVEGSTIHSFFRFAPQLIEKANIQRDFTRQDLFGKIDMIVIDEISMVRVDLLDGIDYSLRLNRKLDTPFGGVQMVFFGDLYQLPPVVVGKDLTDYFEEHFGGAFFFNAKVFNELSFDYIELQTIFRQKDEHFKDILNSIRENRVTQKELELLNDRHNPTHAFDASNVCLTLSTTNKIADDVNLERMNNLTSKEFFYPAIITGRFDKASYPTEPKLFLKEGAQIMMLKNDSQKRWVNGTLGLISDLTEAEVTIEIDGTNYTIEKATWEVIEYQYNKEEKKIEAIVAGSFTQFPVKLAWAITIHKSQGQTFDNVVIDLGNGAFTHGQTYVALSRCTSLEGITLKTQIRQRDIILDPKVSRFIKERTKHFSS
jgi:ATP-dependent exoDNAse (exonuclease V) alpha subunit